MFGEDFNISTQNDYTMCKYQAESFVINKMIDHTWCKNQTIAFCMFLSFVRTYLRFLQANTYKLPIHIFYTVSSAKNL